MTKIKEDIVPLSIDTIKEYFKDKEIKFLIDYENSKLSDKVFLTYVSNIDIPMDIKIDKSIDQEKLFSLIDAYMDVKTISDINFLNMIMAHVILKAAGHNTSEMLENSFLTEEQVDEFINTRREKIAKWVTFIDSTMLYLIYSIKDLNEQVRVDESFDVIDDPDFVGLNIINLLKIPGFLLSYFSNNIDSKMYWFKPQFETYMFKGKTFFEFYQNEENILIPLLISLIENKLPMDPRELYKENLGLI